MRKKIVLRLLLITMLMLMFAVPKAGWAITPAPPCEGVTCDTLPTTVCNGGFRITLTNFEPSSPSNNNTATYKYSICSPDRGTCESIVRPGESCLDNSFCQSNGQNTDPEAFCRRDCAVDTFLALRHFDVTFPELGNSCLGGNTVVTGECSCTDIPEFCEVNSKVSLGDEACFSNAPGNSGDKVVARCDGILGLNPRECVIMTLHIAGENTGLGLGAATVVGATDTACIASCLAGPSCTSCEEEKVGPECLVRTKGFWGTHPKIAAQYDPVTVCGIKVEGQQAGTCSTSQALCTNANDYKQNPPYLSFIAQLTAAKLNLNATRALFNGSCSTWEYQGRSIQEWIDHCEDSYCSASKQQIGRSGCIEALTAFNESQDTGFAVTPPPFDQPGPADPSQCQEARGNGIFIGEYCKEQPPPAYSKESKPGRGKGQ